MKILAIDSATKCVSACILDQENIVAEFFLNNGLTHSQTLMPIVKKLFEISGLSVDDVDLFAVSTGPGSFTGVRIGVSTAKGLAFPDNKPCVSVSTLEAMAYNFVHLDCLVCATIDARCQNVYNALFRIKNAQVSRVTVDRLSNLNSLVSELVEFDQKIVFVGDGAVLCYNLLEKNSNDFILAPNFLINQRASSVAFCAKASLLNSKTLDAKSLNPVYLRPCQAQRELQTKEGNS